MRNFEERKAEIFRRSEKRIRERKRNLHAVLALCIPLCLILAALSVTLLPSMDLVSHDGAENVQEDGVKDEMAAMDDADATVLVHSFVSVEVKGTGLNSEYHSVIESAPEVTGVFEQIYSILILHESHNDIVGEFNESEDGFGSEGLKDQGANSKASGYTVTMITAKGIKRTFILTENKLYDAKTNMEIDLTDGQTEDLRWALGLTD